MTIKIRTLEEDNIAFTNETLDNRDFIIIVIDDKEYTIKLKGLEAVVSAFNKLYEIK